MPIKINFVGSSLTEGILVGTISCKKMDERKARARGLTFNDDYRRAVGMLNSMRHKKRQVPGGEKERHLPVSTACSKDR